MIFDIEVTNKKMGIYIIFNSYKNKYYIGQTTRTFLKRFNDHKTSLIKNTLPNGHLQNDFNSCFKELKHDDFLQFQILESIEDQLLLDNKEIRYIADYREKYGKENIYNIMPGGNCFLNEKKKKISDTSRGKHYSVATEFKTGQTLEEKFGIEKAKEIRLKLRNSKLGGKVSEETKKKQSAIRLETNYLKGKTFEEVFGIERATELKKNISLISKGRPSPMKGKTHTPETRAKIRANRPVKLGADNLTSKQYDFSNNPLLSPNGSQTLGFNGLTDFCRKNNLSAPSLCCLIKGKIKTHKGWHFTNFFHLFNINTGTND